MDFLSEDFDPEIHPEYPWNRAPTDEELWADGGPMRELTVEELHNVTRKQHLKRPRDSDEADGDGNNFDQPLSGEGPDQPESNLEI